MIAETNFNRISDGILREIFQSYSFVDEWDQVSVLPDLCIMYMDSFRNAFYGAVAADGAHRADHRQLPLGPGVRHPERAGILLSHRAAFQGEVGLRGTVWAGVVSRARDAENGARIPAAEHPPAAGDGGDSHRSIDQRRKLRNTPLA